MELLRPGRSPRLETWKARPFSPGAAAGPGPGDLRLDFERTIGKEKPGPPEEDGPHRRASRAVLAYRAFPPSIIEGVLVRTPVEVGDTVGTLYKLPGDFRLFFASRVVARFDGAESGLWRTGFTYRTLRGHPELGEETFSIDKVLASGEVRAALRSWSRPGLFSTGIVRPLLRYLQRRANQAALDELTRVAAGPARAG